MVPVLSVRLRTQTKETGKSPTVKLSYKRGAKRITTQLPVIDIKVDAGDLFGFGMDVTLLLEAQDKQGNVVGEPKPGVHDGSDEDDDD